MQRIDGPTATLALPAAAPLAGTPGYFTPGDPQIPTPPTIVPADWFNMIQEELVTVVLAAGLALDKADRGQLLAAIGQIFVGTLATDAETIAGVLTTKGVSPHGVKAVINTVLNGAPAALDTLNELADAIGDDANFAGTVTAALAQRVQLSRQIATAGLATGGGDLSGNRTITVPKAAAADILAGTADNMAMTPAGLAAAGGSNANGFWAVTGGGFIEQWGSTTLGASGGNITSGEIVFPRPFTDASTIVVTGSANHPGSTIFGGYSVFCNDPTTTGCHLLADTGDDTQHLNLEVIFRWRAIGR